MVALFADQDAQDLAGGGFIVNDEDGKRLGH
jgi:hypothetical protein